MITVTAMSGHCVPDHCTAFGFWDTGLNTTQRRQQFEAASGGIGLA